jgi:hypothetical protein
MAERGKEVKFPITLTPEQRAQVQQVIGKEFEWMEVAVEADLLPELLEERVAPAGATPGYPGRIVYN